MIRETHEHCPTTPDDHEIHVKIYRTPDRSTVKCGSQDGHLFSQVHKCRIYVDGGSKMEHEVRFCVWCGFVEGQDV